MFQNEETMVCNFVEYLAQISNLWGKVRVGTEFFYQRGRTDLVAVSDEGNVIAFEAKLNKWKIALHQAYRNRCFADLSYVILPEKQALIASRYEGEFIKRGVGLCYISGNNKVSIIYDAELSVPLQPWLRDRALLYVCEGVN